MKVLKYILNSRTAFARVRQTTWRDRQSRAEQSRAETNHYLPRLALSFVLSIQIIYIPILFAAQEDKLAPNTKTYDRNFQTDYCTRIARDWFVNRKGTISLIIRGMVFEFTYQADIAYPYVDRTVSQPYHRIEVRSNNHIIGFIHFVIDANPGHSSYGLIDEGFNPYNKTTSTESYRTGRAAIFVDEDCRRYGLGRILLALAERIALSAGAEEFKADGVGGENYHNFYKLLGYAPFDPDGYALNYSKLLVKHDLGDNLIPISNETAQAV